MRRRLRPVRAARRLLVAECDNLCAAVARDVGKSSEETLGAPTFPSPTLAVSWSRGRPAAATGRGTPAGCGRSGCGDRATPSTAGRAGVVAVIGTWNYPLVLNGVQIVQALTAGNAVLWKPSEVSPSCAVLLHDLLLRAGFPAALVQLLEATREAGAALVDRTSTTSLHRLGPSPAAASPPRWAARRRPVTAKPVKTTWLTSASTRAAPASRVASSSCTRAGGKPAGAADRAAGRRRTG